VDASDVTPDGQRFKNIDEYKRLLLKDKDQLARALAEKLLTYGTGAAPTIADRPAIDVIVGIIRSRDYGFRTLVHEIVQSKAFRTSEVHRNLLTYLAEKSLAGDAENIKEYTVGLDVFGKPDSYDPRQESTVRMHVARLRQKLAEYYATEGVDDPIILSLPKGGFRVTFEARAVAALADADVPAAARKSGRPARYWLEVSLVAALLVAVGAALYFANRLWRIPEATVVEMSPELRNLEPL
jgi:hypothetical protein